jgi:hypothetical protein
MESMVYYSITIIRTVLVPRSVSNLVRRDRMISIKVFVRHPPCVPMLHQCLSRFEPFHCGSIVFSIRCIPIRAT